MLIGIEAERANHPQKTGVEHYAQQLILHLAHIDRKNNYILYLRTKPEPWFFTLPQNFRVKVMPFPIFWTQLRLSWEFLFHPPDVLLIPASALPLIHPDNSVITVHDTGYLFFPEAFSGFMRRYLIWSTRYAARSARHIIAVSESTRQDHIRHFHIPPEKISVVHMGYDPVMPSEESVSREIKDKLPDRYILFLSTLQPRKNLPRLIAAFRRLKQEHPDLPHKLAVVGKPGWKYEDSLEAIDQNKDKVSYLNHVNSNAERTYIYQHADLFIVPSLYEGFGMWILEAFAAGTPVITSNVSSLPEIAGDAALYCDPKNIDSIKNAIYQLLTDPNLARNLAAKGQERLKDFSWEKCARETLAILES